MNFPSIRLEGSILTADVVDAIAREEKHFQKPSDFGLDSSAKVKDEIATTWASAKALWTGYQSRITKLREGQTGVSETRSLFVLPLLSLLGYQPEKTDAEIVNAKSYAISHRDASRDGFPLHIVGWNDSLDKKRVSGGPRISSHALVQEYLNLTEHLYGLITNGRLLRLLRDSSRLIKLSFLEFDLMRIFEEDLYADFAILFRLLHASRMPANRAGASGSVIEKYHQESVDSGLRIRDGLASAVAYSMQTVANGLLAHPANSNLVDGLRDNSAGADELHQDLLRWVYRTLFLLVIEERGLNHAPEATLRQRRFYRDFYSLQRLRRLADRPQLADRRAHDLWRSMHQTLRLYEAGGKGLPLGVAPLGSFLFREEGLRNLFQYELDNRSFLQALNRLSTFTHPDTKVRVRVNYGALDVEEFGSVYESLLELCPRIIPDDDRLNFSYAQLAGNERKTTGSYYTPDSLVQCLLDSALDPVVDERLKGKTGEEAEQALLSIKVCDPAVGSGHFLIGAAHRLAQRLADIRAGEEALSPNVQRHALRDVVNRCLYGVDINPLSAELCKVSLWMLAMEPGKPLGFLDHHIQCGNSLLGVTPRLLHEGIPDDAFKPIADDDKKSCADFKKENKKEARDAHRQRQGVLFDREDRPWEHLGNLAAHLAQLSDLPDETSEQIHVKEQRYAELVRSSRYKSGHLLADAWCAAFVWKKCKPANGGFDYPITNDIFWKLERNPHSIPSWMREEIQRLREQYQFFHWHLAFPEVFPVPGKGERPANEHAGWNGGFDLMLGNPPWERVKIEEQEWFAGVVPDVAEETNASKRREKIAALAETMPSVSAHYFSAVRESEGIGHMLRDSGLFPLCGRGDVNTYSVFTELSYRLLSTEGHSGSVVMTGIATDDTTKQFFREVMNSRRLRSLFAFWEIRRFFPGTDSRNSFGLLTLAGAPAAEGENPVFVFHARSLDEIRNEARQFELDVSDIALLNPKSGTCPVFTRRRDAEINKQVYRNVPLLATATRLHKDELQWGAFYMRLVDLGDHKDAIRDSIGETALDWDVPLYESKMIGSYDHRFGSFDATVSMEERQKGQAHSLSADDKRDANLIAEPRFLVRRDLVEELNHKYPQFNRRWLLVWRDVSNVGSERTSIAAVIPRHTASRTCPGLGFTAHDCGSLLVGVLNSFAFDYFARQKVSGLHFNWTLLGQLPVLPPADYAEPCAWAGQPGGTHRDWLLPRVLELTYTAWDLEPFGRDCGWFGPPFVWDKARRFQLRCELDAAFLHLYGLSREDAAYILDTFPIVRRKDIAATEVKDSAGNVIKEGIFRTKDTILALYDQLAEAQLSGHAFVSVLDPAPASFRVAHQPRLPSEERIPLGNARNHLLEFIVAFYHQTHAECTVRLLREAYVLMIHRNARAAEIRQLLGEVGQGWLKTFNDPLDAGIFRETIETLVGNGKLLVRRSGDERQLILGPDVEITPSPWRNADASVALAILASRPEIITIDLRRDLPDAELDRIRGIAV